MQQLNRKLLPVLFSNFQVIMMSPSSIITSDTVWAPDSSQIQWEIRTYPLPYLLNSNGVKKNIYFTHWIQTSLHFDSRPPRGDSLDIIPQVVVGGWEELIMAVEHTLFLEVEMCGGGSSEGRLHCVAVTHIPQDNTSGTKFTSRLSWTRLCPHFAKMSTRPIILIVCLVMHALLLWLHVSQP